MVLREFTKSKEGVAEYEKYGLKYEDNLQDELYENWLKETTAENLSEFTNKKEKEISTIRVKQVSRREYDDNGKEMFDYFLVWDVTVTRVDRAGNVVQRYLPKMGTYPVIRPHYRLGNVEFGKVKREIDYVEGYDVGYVLPWTKANLLKLIKDIPLTKENGGPGCGVITAGGIRLSVDRFETLLNAKSFNDLTGKTSEEALTKILRQRSDQITGVQEKPLTASDVEKILESKQQQQQHQQQQQQLQPNQ